MTKIAKHVFQIFLCSIFPHHDLEISCTTSRGKIFQNRHVFHDKKIEKDVKNQILKTLIQWIMGFVFDLE